MKISHLLQEAILLESSTAIPFMKDSPGGLELAKAMHSQYQLDTDQKFEKVPKLNWTDIKGGGDRRTRWRRDFIGTWVIMLFPSGAAAVKYTDNYVVITANGKTGKIESENFSSSKGVTNFIKTNLDMPRLLSSKAKIYVGDIKKTKEIPSTNWRGGLDLTPGTYKDWRQKLKQQELTGIPVTKGGTRDVEMAKVTGRELHKLRNERAKELALIQKSSPEKLLQRFKPLWLKAAKAALADVGGVIQTMAKTGAYERLKNKIEKNTTPLENIIAKLETTGTIDTGRGYSRYSYREMGYLEAAIRRAVALTAVYYYPDETGNVSQNGTPDNEKGVANLMSDIDSGDMKKLKTIMLYFKEELMRVPSH